MATDSEHAVRVLNHLIEVCKDGQTGYTLAAEKVENDQTKALLFHHAQQRAQYAGELQNDVLQLGGEYKESGTLAAAALRGWAQLKETLGGVKDEVIYRECEQGDRVALEVYEDALKQHLPEYLAETVRRQHDAIRAAMVKMAELSRVTANKPV